MNDKDQNSVLRKRIRINSEREIQTDVHGQLLLVFFCAFLTVLLSTTSCSAQVAERDYTYKFTIEGIKDRRSAKQLVFDFDGWNVVRDVDYFDACRCFKLTTYLPLDYNSLATFLRARSIAIPEKIEADDGSLLIKPSISSKEYMTE
jgi:hypothetical protein